MFRNYLAAALRNLARNRLYAAINVVGLSVGLRPRSIVLTAWCSRDAWRASTSAHTRYWPWANVIAWPVAGYIMYRWLLGFVYRIDLQPWVFIASSLVALFIAMFTVGTLSMLVARANAVAALRYE